MRATTQSLCTALLISGTLPAQPEVHPDELVLKPKIDAAIENGVEALLQSQLRDGTWGRYGRFDGGKTALCAYALLKCGVGVDHPATRRALLYLDGVRPRETYTVACMMLAYAAAGSKAHLARVKTLTKHLVDWQRGGVFGYPFQGEGSGQFGRPDLSNTQYAALGLWVAQKHKIRIPSKVWLELIESTMTYRAKTEAVKPRVTDINRTVSAGKIQVRGFSYRPNGKPSGSMTAGVSILQICKLGLGGKLRKKGRRAVEEAIEQGQQWLGHHFSVRRNPGRGGTWHYYYLYGLERVGSLTRVEEFAGHWWYVQGARTLINMQNGNGSWNRGKDREVQTSFALLFLRRATSFGAAVTGGKSNHTKRHLFSAGGSGTDVPIKGAGQQPLALYIPGFGPGLKARHGQYGIRVVQVEYLLGGRVLGQLEGKPTKAWKSDTFLYRANALRRGVHQGAGHARRARRAERRHLPDRPGRVPGDARRDSGRLREVDGSRREDGNPRQSPAHGQGRGSWFYQSQASGHGHRRRRFHALGLPRLRRKTGAHDPAGETRQGLANRPHPGGSSRR